MPSMDGSVDVIHKLSQTKATLQFHALSVYEIPYKLDSLLTDSDSWLIWAGPMWVDCASLGPHYVSCMKRLYLHYAALFINSDNLTEERAGQTYQWFPAAALCVWHRCYWSVSSASGSPQPGWRCLWPDPGHTAALSETMTFKGLPPLLS